MATISTDLKTRINNDLALLGSFTPQMQTTLVADAVTEFCRAVDPVVSAVLAVTAGTKTYAIPASISKVERVFDSDLNAKVYSVDEYSVKITFQNDVETGNYTVYGQPKNIKTNIDAVLAGLSEDYEAVIWQYVRAFAHKAADSDKYITESQLARNMALSLIEDRNRGHGYSGQTIQFRDTTGALVADAANVEGITPAMPDFLETAEYQ